MPGEVIPCVEAVVCAGEPDDMGRAQGQACAPALLRLDRELLELATVAAMGLERFDRLARRLMPSAGALAHRLMAADLAAHYPRQYARTVGIAAGAGVPIGWLLLAPAIELGLNRVSYRTPGACTAIAVTGERARGGEPVIAKNFDYPPGALGTYLVRRSRPARAAASLDVTAAPFPGAHEGVNEHGLAVAYNYGRFRGVAGARVSITQLVQELLERCGDVDDALAHLSRRPRAGGAILMLADAHGAAASVELSPDRLGVRRARDHGNLLCSTNHADTDDIAPHDIPGNALLSRWNPRAVRGQRVHQSSEARQQRALMLLALAGPAGAAELAAALADHGADGQGSDDTICRHGPYYQTTCSLLLFPRQRAMRVMFGAPCRGTYTELAL